MRSATTTVEPDSHVASAAYLMKRAHDSALVVTSGDGRVRSRSSPTPMSARRWPTAATSTTSRINQLHLSRPAVVHPGTSVAEAAERMLELSLQHLPVMDDGQLVGLIDMAAVCRALLDQGTRSRAGALHPGPA